MAKRKPTVEFISGSGSGVTASWRPADKFIRVVSMDAEGAKAFCRDWLGVPAERLWKVEDAGPAGRPERYKTEAREFHVYLEDPK
jgi:hypothetical protein